MIDNVELIPMEIWLEILLKSVEPKPTMDCLRHLIKIQLVCRKFKELVLKNLKKFAEKQRCCESVYMHNVVLLGLGETIPTSNLYFEDPTRFESAIIKVRPSHCWFKPIGARIELRWSPTTGKRVWMIVSQNEEIESARFDPNNDRKTGSPTFSKEEKEKGKKEDVKFSIADARLCFEFLSTDNDFPPQWCTTSPYWRTRKKLNRPIVERDLVLDILKSPLPKNIRITGAVNFETDLTESKNYRDLFNTIGSTCCLFYVPNRYGVEGPLDVVQGYPQRVVLILNYDPQKNEIGCYYHH